MSLIKDTALAINNAKLETLEDVLRIVKSMDSLPAIRGYIHSEIDVNKEIHKRLKERL